MNSHLRDEDIEWYNSKINKNIRWREKRYKKIKKND